MTDSFFDKLSDRFRSENDLSDITWAICEACPIFQKLFVQFFFNDISDISKISIFKREHSSESCRPDFYIKIGNTELVVECKINDRNHHFEQYKSQFPNARFGYITNYPLTHSGKDYEIRQWSEFKTFLEAALTKETDIQTVNLISGYLKYLTNVCGIFNLRKMNLNNLSSLYHFNHLIKKIASSIDDHESSLYNQGKNYDAERSGQYFELKKSNNNKVWPWLGVYYTERVCIYMEFNQKWCKKIYDCIDLTRFSKGGEYFDAPYKDYDYGPAVCFELKEFYFSKFNDEKITVEEQEKIVRNFVNEVFACVTVYLTD
jgi:hypothetical protein